MPHSVKYATICLLLGPCLSGAADWLDACAWVLGVNAATLTAMTALSTAIRPTVINDRRFTASSLCVACGGYITYQGREADEESGGDGGVRVEEVRTQARQDRSRSEGIRRRPATDTLPIREVMPINGFSETGAYRLTP